MNRPTTAARESQDVVLQLAGVTVVRESVEGRGRTRDVRRTTVLDQVSLVVRRGRTTGIVAESGAGADALVRVLGGIIEPTGGTVSLPRGPSAGPVQVVLTNAEVGIDRGTTVDEHVGWMTASLPGQIAVERRARTLEVVALVGLHPEDVDRPVWSLTAADRRRVLLARAAAAQPEVLILENLTVGLGPIDRGQLLDAVTDVRASLGCAVVVFDRDVAFAAALSDQLAVLHSARVVEIGPTAQVLGAAAHPYARAVFDALPVPRPGGRADRDRPPALLPTAEPTPGCRFHTRCRYADVRCRTEAPELAPTAASGGASLAACFHPVS